MSVRINDIGLIFDYYIIVINFRSDKLMRNWSLSFGNCQKHTKEND